MVDAVLMLNSDLSPIKMPIQRLDFEQAIKRVMAGSCYVVLSYDRKIKTAHPRSLGPVQSSLLAECDCA
jgi:hypothetical protein